jgi:acetoin utilization deacetylase AcuC-like enzyme
LGINIYMQRIEPSVSRRAFLDVIGAATLGLCAAPLAGASLGNEDASRIDADAARRAAKTGLVRDDRYLLHTQGARHPESPERLRAIDRQLKSSGLDQEMIPLAPSIDPLPYIRMVHSAAHMERVVQQAHDEAICRLAVSGALSAVNAVCSGQVKNAFCAIRPPGHHAANNGEFGFCFYNNIAVAARYAQQEHQLAKILIVDWDYHHGDGTEWAFYEDPSVLVFSTHALYAFPGSGAADKTGSGDGAGFNINVPLPRGADNQAIIRAFTERLMPAAASFQPDLVLISAGFDARAEDPLGDFNISDAGFAQLTEMVMAIAATYANSRVVSILEGGYNTQGLALAVESHVKSLLGRA